MTLGFIAPEAAECSLCKWTAKGPDREKRLWEHLRMQHNRILINREEGKAIIRLTGVRWANEVY